MWKIRIPYLYLISLKTKKLKVMSEKEKNEKKLQLWNDGITIEDAKDLTGLSQTTIDNYIRKGELPWLRVGSNIRLIRQTVVDLIKIGVNVEGVCENELLRKYAK